MTNKQPRAPELWSDSIYLVINYALQSRSKHILFGQYLRNTVKIHTDTHTHDILKKIHLKQTNI